MRKRRSSPEKNYRAADKTPGYRGPLADIESNYAALEHFKVEMRGGGDSAENRGARLNESLKREAFQRESTLNVRGVRCPADARAYGRGRRKGRRR